MLPDKKLSFIGEQLRARRKRLKISTVVTAEAASISRMTLHRIERGDVSVAIGAYLSVISSLGFELVLSDPRQEQKKKSHVKLPTKIRIADYPQLKRLAWQLKRSAELSPQEVLSIYERNWRHIDLRSLDSEEQELIEKLLVAFGKERLFV
jgi:transcriptional regulator with XRE-family HTH domain